MTKTAVSLFAGAGGECLGLKLAGVDVLASFERDDDAVATLESNWLPAVQADLSTFDWQAWMRKNPHPDIVAGGPPCQPFSAAGRHQGEQDERNGIPAYIRAIDWLRPDLFVMENVKGLTFKKHRFYLDEVCDRFRHLGYLVEWRVLNAADYGVPQRRERLFVVGVPAGRVNGKKNEIRWPAPTHSRDGEELPKWVTMAHALSWDGIVNTRGDRQTPGGNNFDSTTGPSWALTEKARSWRKWEHVEGKISLNRRQNNVGPVDVEENPSPTPTAAAMEKGRWQIRWPHERPATTVQAGASGRIGRPGHKNWDKDESQFQQDMVRVTPEEAAVLQDFPMLPDWVYEKPAPTVSTTHGGVGGSQVGGHVNLTSEEAQWLQAFPVPWSFVGSRSSVFRQIGNACPPRLAWAVVGAQIGSWPVLDLGMVPS